MHAALPATPLDLVGDIHGELDALRAVLAAAGYDPQGRHPDGRTLVFVGDLVDRGPDSPGVVAWVRRLVDAGRALAIMGNHELNLLRDKRKHGSDWFWDEGSHHDARYAPYARLDAAGRAEMLKFFAGLPLVLERPDLRVVHAAWHAASVARLRALAPFSCVELFQRLDEEANAQLVDGGWLARSREEKARWRHHYADPDFAMPMLEAVGQVEEWRQMLNPIRVLTSGLERKASAPFFASGQWRFAARVPWWETYTDPTPVVVGHYWRQYVPLDRAALGKGDADLFTGIAPDAWLGPRGHVYCIDFSVGGRYQERLAGRTGDRTRLALLRWPERELVFDNGERAGTTGFGESA